MKKILFILLVVGSCAFSDCKAKAEYGIKEIVKTLNVNSQSSQKLEKTYKFLGIDDEGGNLYIYKINILDNNKSVMEIYGVVDVKSGQLFVKSDLASSDVMVVSESDSKAICN